MCSFLLTNLEREDFSGANYYQAFRGPDRTTSIKDAGITFLHNLLSITGKITTQPFQSDRYIAMYNGEIYNAHHYGIFESDGQCILPALDSYGDLFARHLDGEYAIVVYDRYLKRLTFSRDTFGTKPLYFAKDRDSFALASYPSALRSLGLTNIFRVPPNKVFSYSISDGTLVDLGRITTFSLAQYKTSYDDWFSAFDKSVKKRVHNIRESLFIGLSSGYDSGAICASLLNLGVRFSAYSLVDHENIDVLHERERRFASQSLFHPLTLDDKGLAEVKSHNEAAIEELYYEIYSKHGDYNEFKRRLHDDTGAIGLSAICRQAKANGQKIYLSGQGADEIVSDYGFDGRRIYKHSNFGGKFPEDLKSIFPWPSFFESSQASYLMKEEHVSGSYGIEGRYPFLDPLVVQEFLWLDVKLKNRSYKSVIFEYLCNQNFPLAEGEKRGFMV